MAFHGIVGDLNVIGHFENRRAVESCISGHGLGTCEMALGMWTCG
jgi:hypothetical protein